MSSQNKKQREKYKNYKELFCKLKYNINKIKVCKNSTKSCYATITETTTCLLLPRRRAGLKDTPISIIYRRLFPTWQAPNKNAVRVLTTKDI